MNKQVLVLAGGAAVVVLFVAILVTIMLGSKPAPKPVETPKTPVSVPKTYVLVAAHDLILGAEVISSDLTWKAVPVPESETSEGIPPKTPTSDKKDAPKDPRDLTNLPLGAITGKTANASTDGRIKGRLRRDIMAGEPVTKTDMVEGNNAVSVVLTPGMRGVTIAVSAESAVGGFIWPGDYVDVVLTYKYKKIDFDDKNFSLKIMAARTVGSVVSETVLQNVRVLAIDQDSKKPAGEVGQVAKTVTLAVNVREAEILAVAKEMGQITLSLRGIGDTKMVDRIWPTPTDARISHLDDEIIDDYVKIQDALEAQGQTSKPVIVYEGVTIQKVSGN